MAKPTEVSADFMSFYQGAASDTVNAAKAAEKMSGNIPLDIGAEGTCLIETFKFSKLPDKTDKGITTVGSRFCEIKYRTLTPDEDAGKVLTQMHWFSDKKGKAGLQQAFQYFFDFLLKIGLPEEVRQNHKHPTELGDYFMTNNITLGYKVVEDKEDRFNGGKRFYINPLKKSIGEITSFVSAEPEVAPATTAPATNLKVGDTVIFQGNSWVIEAFYNNNKVGLKNANGEDTIAVSTELQVDSSPFK